MTEIIYKAGAREVARTVRAPFDDLVIDFLNDLSKALQADPRSPDHPDVLTFAFWCRSANVRSLKERSGGEHRLGRGVILHITPSNVPINFAFSFVFGLLSGNANIIRLPSKPYFQVEIVCDAIRSVFSDPKYGSISASNSFITYPRNDDITAELSLGCDGRVIWGGDETVRHIRSLPMSERGVELAFADRYSLCVIDQQAIGAMEDKELHRLAERFYNDTYLMDQNACSSPYLIVWVGSEDVAAQDRFWAALHAIVAAKYDLEPISGVDKYTRFCEAAIRLDTVAPLKRTGNLIYRIRLRTVPEQLHRYKENSGFFFEYSAADLKEIAHIINGKYQTLTYFGVEKETLRAFITDNALHGIDRIVPIGQALDIGLFWDGYDVVRTLSRIIDVR